MTPTRLESAVRDMGVFNRQSDLVPSPPSLCSPPVWETPPDCPKCGKPLSEAPEVWRPRGEWMCHEDHDGKSIWFNYELTMILRARLHEANAEMRNRQP